MRSITTSELHDIHLDPAGTIVDARSAGEFAEGHVPGAVNIPHDEIDKRFAEVPKDKPVYVHCALGGRAQKAAAVLVAHGYEVHCVTDGGMKAWKQANLPVTS